MTTSSTEVQLYKQPSLVSLPELCEAVSEKLNACKQRKQEARAVATAAQQEAHLTVPTGAEPAKQRQTPSPNQVDPDGRVLLSLTRPTPSASFQQPRAPPPSPGDVLEEDISTMECPAAEIPVAQVRSSDGKVVPPPPPLLPFAAQPPPQLTHYPSPAVSLVSHVPSPAGPPLQQVTPVLPGQQQPTPVTQLAVPGSSEAPILYPPTTAVITHQQPYPTHHMSYMPPCLPPAQPYPSITTNPMMYPATMQAQQPIIVQPTIVQPPPPPPVVQQQPQIVSQPTQNQQTMNNNAVTVVNNVMTGDYDRPSSTYLCVSLMLLLLCSLNPVTWVCELPAVCCSCLACYFNNIGNYSSARSTGMAGLVLSVSGAVAGMIVLVIVIIAVAVLFGGTAAAVARY